MREAMLSCEAHLDLLSAQGAQPSRHWSLNGHVKTLYSKEIRGNIFVVTGRTSALHHNEPLALAQPWLAIQLMLLDDAPFSMDLALASTDKQIHRLRCSTSYRATKVDPLHTQVSLADLPRGKWFTLWISLSDMLAVCFGSEFHCLVDVHIGSSCHLRRIVACESGPAEVGGCDLPAKLNFHAETPATIKIVDNHSLRHSLRLVPKVQAAAEQAGAPAHQPSPPPPQSRRRVSATRHGCRSARPASLSTAETAAADTAMANAPIYAAPADRPFRRQNSAPVARPVPLDLDTNSPAPLEDAFSSSASSSPGFRRRTAASPLARNVRPARQAFSAEHSGSSCCSSSLAVRYPDTAVQSSETADGPMFIYQALPRTPPLRHSIPEFVISESADESDGLHAAGDFASAANTWFRSPAADAAAQVVPVQASEEEHMAIAPSQQLPSSHKTAKNNSSSHTTTTTITLREFNQRLRELRSQLGHRDRSSSAGRRRGSSAASHGRAPSQGLAAAAALASAASGVPATAASHLASSAPQNQAWSSARSFVMPSMAVAAANQTWHGRGRTTSESEEQGRTETPLPPLNLTDFQLADDAFLASESWREDRITSSAEASPASSPTPRPGTVHGVPVTLLLAPQTPSDRTPTRPPTSPLARGQTAANSSAQNSLASSMDIAEGEITVMNIDHSEHSNCEESEDADGDETPAHDNTHLTVPGLSHLSVSLTSSFDASIMDRRLSQHGGTPLPGTLHSSVADWTPGQLADTDRWSPEPMSLSRMASPMFDMSAEKALLSSSGELASLDTDLSDTPPALSSPKSTRGSPLHEHGGRLPSPRMTDGGDGDQIELVYDRQLNCYFNPVTHRYYRLM